MNPKLFLGLMVLVTVTGLVLVDQRQARAGEVGGASGYKVLDPIRHGNLTIFPVVAAKSYPTGEFLTLDEGLRSGEVVVTEAGNVQGLVRRHITPAIQHDGAQVNRLVLINNSKRPLLLLAGEIVTGGKQDRVIGKDRIVPPESEPVDLSVFCVEPGRWVATSEHFGASEAMYGSNAVGGPARGAGGGIGSGAAPAPMAIMAQPSVRAKAMADKDQSAVWAEVRKQQAAVIANNAATTVPHPTPPGSTTVEVNSDATLVARELAQTSSYAKVMENDEVKKQVDAVAKPIEQNYQSLIGQLRDRHAVGVVVAVNGRIIWADVFASTDLLEKYWPKLVRSYASEAVVTRAKEVDLPTSRAQAFLEDMEGRRETIESEPGIYRHTQVNGDGFKAFALTSLLPKTGFDVHVAKMAE
jgi:ARG and Rhodanese-Phosphatase-superfamily-associated Protein domain